MQQSTVTPEVGGHVNGIDSGSERLVQARARKLAARLAVSYALLAGAWILISDAIGPQLMLPPALFRLFNTGKGVLFVLVTAVLLYALSSSLWGRSLRENERYRQAQESVHERDRSIRQAYIDILDAVTGGKLILMWPEDLEPMLGEVVLPLTDINEPQELAEARRRIAEALGRLDAESHERVIAASEGLTNALKHGTQGCYEVRGTALRAQVVIEDRGPGIDFHTLPKATLVPGFSTKPSLGMGFTIMLEVAERVLLSTEPGRTILVLEFPRAASASADVPTPT